MMVQITELLLITVVVGFMYQVVVQYSLKSCYCKCNYFLRFRCPCNRNRNAKVANMLRSRLRVDDDGGVDISVCPTSLTSHLAHDYQNHAD